MPFPHRLDLTAAERAELLHLRDSEGVTVMLTTHLLEEAERCDRLGILDQGKLVAEGAPEELKSKIGGGLPLRVTSKSEGDVVLKELRNGGATE